MDQIGTPDALIVAPETPSVDLPLGGQPVLMHLLEAELVAAGIVGLDIEQCGDALVLLNESGEAIDMPPDLIAQIRPVLAQHVIPEPVMPPSPADILEAVASAIETAKTPADQAAAIREMAVALRSTS